MFFKSDFYVGAFSFWYVNLSFGKDFLLFFFFLLIFGACAKNDDFNHELPQWLKAKLLGGRYPGMKREPKAAWLWLQSFRPKSATLSTALTSAHSTSSPWYHMHNPKLKAPSHPKGKLARLVKKNHAWTILAASFLQSSSSVIANTACPFIHLYSSLMCGQSP